MQNKFSGSVSNGYVLFALLVFAAACSILCATLLGSSQSRRPTNPSQRTLTFEDRVAYQRLIEEVYWRHRIRPRNRGERPDPKPSLDAVMSQAQLEKKVRDYLQKSQALADYGRGPITADELQAEMDRMAQHTKQPEVLRELFEALGNDPVAISECLAKPVLAQRVATSLDTSHQNIRGELQRIGDVNPRLDQSSLTNNAGYKLPSISDRPNGCTDDTWTATSTTNAPSPRDGHTAVWTGTEMIIWGGGSNTGGRYDPSTDTWTATSTTNAPDARGYHTAVWTGTEMIVWGGGGNGSYLNTGGRYNPATDSWTATSTANAPDGRLIHTAVWTGTEMIVWGGQGPLPPPGFFNTGGRYNPSTDSWTATSIFNAPVARGYDTAVWTGSEMIVWGGYPYTNSGGRYEPGTDSWTATSLANAPVARGYHTAVWVGSQMIVWGGANDDGLLNTGGRYNPGTNLWSGTSIIGAPTGRFFPTAVWTGSEMIVWGGHDDSFNYSNTGGRYHPGTDSWTPTSTTNAPDARSGHTAVWIDSEMIVWGGHDDSGNLNTGGRYCAQSSATPTPTPRLTPSPRSRPTPAPRP